MERTADSTKESAMTSPAPSPGSPQELYRKAQDKAPLKANLTITTTTPTTKTSCCSTLVLANSCIVLGVLFVLVGVLYGTVLPGVVNKTIRNGVAKCTNDEYAKDSYMDPFGDCESCNSFVYKYHPYNVTNADQVLQGAKAQLQELGPYAYRKRIVRTNVQFDGHNKVTYQSYTFFTFDPSRSCKTCSPHDVLTVFDLSVLGIMNRAGGEYNFLKTLLKAMPGGNESTDAALDMKIKMGGAMLLKIMYGYNSLSPEAMKNLGTKTALALATQDLVTLMSLKMEGFDYNGVFKKLTVQQAAIGHPSMMVGTVLGKNYLEKCVKGGLNEKCANCQGEECGKIASECVKCARGATVHEMNALSCGQIEQIYAAAHGAKEASEFVTGTCKTCALTGFCAAQIHGTMEATGFDWSRQVPPPQYMFKYVQKAGCDGDLDHINDFETFKNYNSTALYVKSNEKANPNAMELASFHADCKNNGNHNDGNLTCVPVTGGDGSAFRPSGVSLAGMPATTDVASRELYVAVGYQNVTVYRTKEKYQVKNIDVVRFRPHKDLLAQHPWNQNMGVGVPFRGVLSLSYAYGFLAYLSFPFFVWGEPSLLDNVELTRADGLKMTNDALYDAKTGELKPEMQDMYSTYLDVEPATGKSMRVVNRCQASIAINKSPSVNGAGLSDILFPKVQTEILWPLFWGEESVIISDHNANRFKSELVGLVKTFLPVFIGGLTLGLGVLALGVVYRIRAKRALQAHMV